MSIKSNFLTWLLIGCQHIASQSGAKLINMDYNMEIS